MQRPTKHTYGGLKAVLLAGISLLSLGVAAVAHAGAGVNDPHEHDDDGPAYFGFVRDARGAPVADAKVTLKLPSGLSYVVRSDRAGLYRARGLGKEIKPADVTISCAKDGYEMLRVVRRPPARGKAVKAVETECRLQKR